MKQRQGNGPGRTGQFRNPRSAWTLLLMAAGMASARGTDGYFSDGYGIKSKGRAGISLTSTEDAFGGANNPATLGRVGERLDLGIDWFRPSRSAERTGPAVPLNGSVDSDRPDFFIPEIAYARPVGEHVSIGLSLYGNGGMNTEYPAGQLNLGPAGTGLNLLAGPGELGVSLQQLLIAPTVAWRISENHTVGLAPIIGYQQFEAYGLAAFSPLSKDPSALTDRGLDDAWGAGVRIGYLWNITPRFAAGASYSSPVFMEKFDEYRGLFADDGAFDIPQNFGVGLSYELVEGLRASVEYKWIDYASVRAVGNPSDSAGRLGETSGPGFGWNSVNVYKLGLDWKVSDHWTLRAGYSYNDNPIEARDVTFNILAPAVVRHHAAAGVTYGFGRQEVTVAFVHAFHESLSGESRFVGLGLAPAGTQETIAMDQTSLALAYSFKF
ncbi:MAG: outer membrane protein transport protein [Verrucomicrobiales bacterium]|nr:outer membrane protein transport protein [Verrucomicrobiales bacterium]